jgi:hypothetical protein
MNHTRDVLTIGPLKTPRYKGKSGALFSSSSHDMVLYCRRCEKTLNAPGSNFCLAPSFAMKIMHFIKLQIYYYSEFVVMKLYCINNICCN